MIINLKTHTCYPQVMPNEEGTSAVVDFFDIKGKSVFNQTVTGKNLDDTKAKAAKVIADNEGKFKLSDEQIAAKASILASPLKEN